MSEQENEIPKYKKKKSQKSKASKRSNHKHTYEPCLLKVLFRGWDGNQAHSYEGASYCTICGHIGSNIGSISIMKQNEKGWYTHKEETDLLEEYKQYKVIERDIKDL